MIPNNIRNIIDRLSERTLSGQTNWNQSSGSNGFRLSMQTGTINIDKWYDDRENAWVIQLKIFNDRGDIIEDIETLQSSNKPDYEYMDSFYAIVRRKYLKVDETLKGFLDELDGNKPIGKNDDPNLEPIDDLPF